MSQTLMILYVADQARSATFYRELLQREPTLDVPGMTEFPLPGGATLGLMPTSGVRTLLTRLPDPDQASGVPRCEIYLPSDDVMASHQRALDAGAKEIDVPLPRDWGDTVAYSLDPDGHVIAFAAPTGTA